MAERTPKRAPSPSHLSDKDIGRAAAERRRVTFCYFNTTPIHQIQGYVVGMDAFHWKVAIVNTAKQTVLVSLIHKARVDVIELSSSTQVSDEEQKVQEALTKIGEPFWKSCESTYLGRH